MAIPGHNMVMRFVWLHVDPCGMDGTGHGRRDAVCRRIHQQHCADRGEQPVIAASIALLTALIVTGIRFGKPDASITANGFVIGMVAVSGVCSLISPAEAAAIGLVAGIMVPFSVELLDRLGVDDPSGSISVHAVGGLWGVIATGPFIQGRPKQWLAQMAMLAALLGFVLPLSY